MQIIYKNQKNETVLILQYSILKSTVIKYNSWHTGAGIAWIGKNSYWLEEWEEAGDGGAKGSSVVGRGGHAAVSLMPDVDGMYICIFESLQLEGLYIGDELGSPKEEKCIVWHFGRLKIKNQGVSPGPNSL